MLAHKVQNTDTTGPDFEGKNLKQTYKWLCYSVSNQ